MSLPDGERQQPSHYNFSWRTTKANLVAVLGMYSLFYESDLELIEQHNLQSTDVGDPVRFIVGFGARPELRELESELDALGYQAGAMIGAVLMRKQFLEMNIPESTFRFQNDDQANAFALSSKGIRYKLTQFVVTTGDEDIKDYLQQTLEATWRRRGYSFMGEETSSGEARNDWIAVGVGDVCAWYNIALGCVPESIDLSPY